MTGWFRFSTARARASSGLVLTLLALVAATTAVIAGTVGYTAAAASESARESVAGSEDLGVTIRTRLASDPDSQDETARRIIHDTFAPAPVTVERTVDDSVADPFVVWRVLPDVEQMAPHHLSRYAEGAERVRLALRSSSASERGVTLEGDLAEAAGVASHNLAVAEALGTIPLSVLILVTFLAVVQVARLLATSRETQVSLLIARGAGPRQVFIVGAAETLVSVVLGVAAGLAIAWAVLQTVPFGAAQWPLLVRTALWCLAGTAAVVLVQLAAQAQALARPGHLIDRSGRSTRAVAGATLLLVGLGATVSAWQLARTGSPLISDGQDYSVNLIAGAAPALLLTAAGVIALGLLGPISALAAAATRRFRGATAQLSITQISRRIRVYGVPVMLTVLATGAATIAGAYAGTSGQLRTDMQALAQGAILKAELQRPPAWTTQGQVAPSLYPDIGEHASSLVWQTEQARIGDLTLTAVAGLPGELAEVALIPGDAEILPSSLRSRETSDLAGEGILLEEGAQRVRATAEVVFDIDAWGVEYLNTVGVTQRQIQVSSGATLDYANQAAEQATAEAASHHGADTHLEVQLFLRDLHTGAGGFVSLGSKPVPGPVVTYDSTTLQDFSAQETRTVLEWDLQLDPQRRFTIDAIVLHLPEPDRGVQLWNRHLTIDFALETTDGDPILDQISSPWASRHATTLEQAQPILAERASRTPTVEALIQMESHGIHVSYRSNEVGVTTVLETSGATWRVMGKEHDMGFWGSTISPAFTPTGPEQGSPAGNQVESGPPVPVSLTPAAAEAAALEPGDEFQLMFMNQHIRAWFADTIDAAPGSTAPHAAFLDIRDVSLSLLGTGQEARYPTQLWIRPDSDPAQTAEALKAEGAVGDVQVAELDPPTDPTRSARLVFWVACVGAVLLAGTGIASVAATITAERRSEVAVLRALGMTPRDQAVSRAAELAVVVGLSVSLGLVSGWLISRFVVPPLAQSTNAPGLVELPPSLSVQVGPWLALLGFGAVLVLVVLGATAHTVRTQALDRTYREEVR